MAQSAGKRRDPALNDAHDIGAAIDRGHLERMTFGDRGLERELLELFDRQAAMVIVRMRAGGAAAIAPFAHTLKGSASGVGAARVAAAAEAAEFAAGRSPAERSLAIDRLVEAVEEVRAHIAELLRAD